MMTQSEVTLMVGYQVGDKVTIVTPPGWGRGPAPAKVIERVPVTNGVVYRCESDGRPRFHPPVWVGELYLSLRE